MGWPFPMLEHRLLRAMSKVLSLLIKPPLTKKFVLLVAVFMLVKMVVRLGELASPEAVLMPM
jgi:hypothetical protein